MKEFLPSAQSCFMPTSGWMSARALRIDFTRLATLARTLQVTIPEEELKAPPPTGWQIWPIEDSLDCILFIIDKTTPLGIFWQDSSPFLAIDPSLVALSVSPPTHPIQKPIYSTSNVDVLLGIVVRSSATLLPKATTPSGIFVQYFTDNGMTDQDWFSLGFAPPTSTRPALDLRGDGKGLSQEYICVPHAELEVVEKSCSGLWNHYEDSSHEGVYFSKLEVTQTVWSGLTGGMAPGSTVVMSPDFREEYPYRPAWSSCLLNPSATPHPKEYTVVFYRSGQYVSLDPQFFPVNPELTVRWKSLPSWESGFFVPKGRYLPARTVRRTHYVAPKARTKQVWEQGCPVPCSEKCLISPDAGGSYTSRPSRQEYRDLVRKYGREAVPRNFNKYKESQIARKSQLTSCVASGGWVFVQTGQDPDVVARNGFMINGEKPLPWRILRQIHLAGELEHDPLGNGMYARLVTRQELFTSPERMKKMNRMMRNEGWDFILEEVISGNSSLKGGVFAMMTS